IVRKADLADSPEALRMGLDMREALLDPLVGAQILDDIPAERIRIIEDPTNVTAPIAGDPYFVDIAESELRSVLGDQADAVLRGEGNLPPTLTRRYRLRSELTNSRFPRLSEAASVRAFKPEKIEKLKELARRHNSLREAELARIFADVDPKMLSQYIYETLPTFGNWVPFLQATSEIRHALMRGDLDAASFVVPRSLNNRRLSSPNGRKLEEGLMDLLLELPDDERTLNSLMRSTYSQFARNLDPVRGSFTVASFDTPLKQDAHAFAQAVEWNIKNLQAVRRAQRDPRIGDAFRRVREIAETEGLPSKDVVREILAETVGTVNERTAALLRRVV